MDNWGWLQKWIDERPEISRSGDMFYFDINGNMDIIVLKKPRLSLVKSDKREIE